MFQDKTGAFILDERLLQVVARKCRDEIKEKWKAAGLPVGVASTAKEEISRACLKKYHAQYKDKFSYVSLMWQIAVIEGVIKDRRG